MALSSKGANLAFQNTTNGKMTPYWGADGNPVFDDNMEEVVASMLEEVAGWYGDQRKIHRSKLSTVKTKDGTTKGRLEQYSSDALQPLIDDRRLQSVTPTAVPSGQGYNLQVAYVTATGIKNVINVPLAG